MPAQHGLAQSLAIRLGLQLLAMSKGTPEQREVPRKSTIRVLRLQTRLSCITTNSKQLSASLFASVVPRHLAPNLQVPSFSKCRQRTTFVTACGASFAASVCASCCHFCTSFTCLGALLPVSLPEQTCFAGTGWRSACGFGGFDFKEQDLDMSFDGSVAMEEQNSVTGIGSKRALIKAAAPSTHLCMCSLYSRRGPTHTHAPPCSSVFLERAITKWRFSYC